MYSNGVKEFLIIDDIKQLRRDLDEDPIIKDSMVAISALLVRTFGKWLSPVLIVCHFANHTKDFVTAETTKQEELEEEYG